MIPGRRLSIGVLVTVTLVVSATTLLAVFGYFSYRTIRDKQYDDLRTTHRQLADSLADALVLPVWNFDNEQIERIFQGAMKNGDVAAVIVRLADRHHTIVGVARDNQGRIHPADLSRAVPGRLHERREIVAGSTNLGSVEVAINPTFIEARLRQTRNTMVAAVLALDALLIVVPGVLLWWLVLAPMKQIELYTAAVRSGDRQDTRLEAQRFRGEPERLRASVEAMMHELLAVNDRYERFEAALTTLTRLDLRQPEDLPAVLRRITEVVARALTAARVSVWRFTDEHGTLLCEDAYLAPDDRHFVGETLTLAEYPDLFRALMGEETLVIADVTTDPRTAAFAGGFLRNYGITSFMESHIRVRGQVFGLLTCNHIGGPRTWTPDEQTFAAAVANLISALMSQVDRQRVEAQLRQAQKLEAIGQLAGGVAHDFNNVLMVILGKAAQIAQDPRAHADVRAAATDIVGSGERAASLTRQLLTFSRRQAIQTRVLDLNAAVRQTARMLQRTLGEAVTMHLVLPPQPAFVSADEGMLDQVLLNLAVNARDAMPGGGHLTIETSGVDGDDGRPFVCLRVSDTGTGIAPEHLPHIFEPFFTTKGVGKGTGLGLAMSYGIVQQHGGRIEVDTEAGRGTTFRVLLPAAAAVPVPAAAETPARSGHETLLIVEDETDVRELVVDWLSTLGYTVIQAPSGRHALEVWAARADEIDLLITDMVMPDGLSGLELATRLRAARPRLKVLYISGYVADLAGGGTLEEGVNYLAKPFSLPDLGRLIRRTLDAPASQPHA